MAKIVKSFVVYLLLGLPLAAYGGEPAKTAEAPRAIQTQPSNTLPAARQLPQPALEANNHATRDAGRPPGLIDELWKGSIAAVPVLLAAFLGPWFAFRLQNRHEAQKAKTSEFRAGLRAQLVLYEQYNALSALNENILDKLRADPQRWLRLEPIIAHLPTFQVDTSTLHFLNERGGNHLHVDVVVAQGNYFLTKKAFASWNMKRGKYARLVKTPGHDTISDQNLTTATNILYECVDTTLGFLKDAINNLAQFLSNNYGDQGVIVVDYDKTPKKMLTRVIVRA